MSAEIRCAFFPNVTLFEKTEAEFQSAPNIYKESVQEKGVSISMHTRTLCSRLGFLRQCRMRAGLPKGGATIVQVRLAVAVLASLLLYGCTSTGESKGATPAQSGGQP